MQSPWQQKPIKFWNIIATEWHLLLPTTALTPPWRTLGCCTPEHFVSAGVRVWHNWTVNRHEKESLIHVGEKKSHCGRQVLEAAQTPQLTLLGQQGA